MISRQFTIRNLLKITAQICVILAIVVTFPRTFLSIAYYCILLFPSILVAGLAIWVADHRYRTTAIMVAMVIFSWLICPGIVGAAFNDVSFWQALGSDIPTFGKLTFLIVFVNALPDYFYCLRRLLVRKVSFGNRNATLYNPDV